MAMFRPFMAMFNYCNYYDIITIRGENMLEIISIIFVSIMFIVSIIILIMDKNSKPIGAILFVLSIIFLSIILIHLII